MDIPRLHPDTVEAVRERADIVDIVSEQVVLKKQGKDFVGLCPFHDDKSPSFSVSPSKQFYYCFSCGAGGNAIKFLMELNQRPFADVVLDLARRYQVPVKTLEPAKRQVLQQQLSLREQLFEILAIAAKFYQHTLHRPDGETALTYLKQQRRLQAATIEQFQLGYAPGGWQTLYGYLVEQKRYPVELVEKAGLIMPRQQGSGYYDRFRDRLMIPIQDAQGRVIGFGGRALGDEQPKYLNSPETELFDKGKTLYGLSQAKAAIAKADCAIVVEGYFDVITLHAAGIANAVASLGTALNAAQVRLLLRYTESKQVVLNFDADAAGVKAAERAIGEAADMAHQGDLQLRVLTMPTGKDPDEYLQTHTATDYQALVAAAPLWLDWQIQQLLQGVDLRQADQFQQTAQTVVALLSEIANANTRTHYIRHCAELFSHGDARLVPLLADSLLAQVRRQRRSPRQSQLQPDTPKSWGTTALEQAEAALLRIFIHSSDYRQAVVEALEERDLQFSFSHHRALWRQIKAWYCQSITTDELHAGFAEWRSQPPANLDQLRDRCAEEPLLGQSYHLLQLDEKTQRDILRGSLVVRAAIACMEKTMCEKRYRYFLNLWSERDCTLTPEQHAYYQKQIYAEKQRIQELEDQRCVTFADLAQIPWVGEFYASFGDAEG
ncbi:MAG: DNA primase [Almyronema sp.]